MPTLDLLKQNNDTFVTSLSTVDTGSGHQMGLMIPRDPYEMTIDQDPMRRCGMYMLRAPTLTCPCRTSIPVRAHIVSAIGGLYAQRL